MTDAPKTIWANNGLYPHFRDDWSDGEWVNDDGQNGVQYTRTDTVEGMKSTLSTAMKLLRDNQSNMHFSREITTADDDVLRAARSWK